jgi:hypothetical protein
MRFGTSLAHGVGSTRPRVGRSRRIEEVKHVLCTRGRPQGEKLMVGVCERALAADGDQARVAGERPVVRRRKPDTQNGEARNPLASIRD